MFKRLKKLLGLSPSTTTLPYHPEGERVYCIGDIHGRLDLLVKLHQKILADAKDFDGSKRIIYLGDYIDRGMQSKEVIDELINNPLIGFDPIYIRGNHEQTLLDFLENIEVGPFWLSVGAQATLFSYQVFVKKIPTKNKEFAELQRSLKTNIPSKHMTFFQKTQYFYSSGNYYFVHAGIDPDDDIESQKPESQMWIRDKFTQSHKNFGKIVVHGHNISKQPELNANRIGIDTGAYASNQLTCLVLEDSKQYFLQT